MFIIQLQLNLRKSMDCLYLLRTFKIYTKALKLRLQFDFFQITWVASGVTKYFNYLKLRALLRHINHIHTQSQTYHIKKLGKPSCSSL